MIQTLFWNTEENRLRAFWRILIQLLLMTGLVLLTWVLTAPLIDPFAASILAYVVGIVPSVWLAGRYLDHRPFTGFGFNLDRRWWIDFAFGLLLGVVLMALIFLLEWSLGWISVMGTVEDQNPHLPFVVSMAGTLFVFLLVGFYEELLSRGYHLTNLAEGLNFSGKNPQAAVWLALILSSVLFGLGHAFNPNASLLSTLNIMAAGVFLGIGYVLTGELGIPIGLHISWNFAQGALFGFPVSGASAHTMARMLVVTETGPDLWTGGAFGPEGGLIGLFTIALGTAAITLWVRWRHGQARIAPRLARPPSHP